MKCTQTNTIDLTKQDIEDMLRTNLVLPPDATIQFNLQVDQKDPDSRFSSYVFSGAKVTYDSEYISGKPG